MGCSEHVQITPIREPDCKQFVGTELSDLGFLELLTNKLLLESFAATSNCTACQSASFVQLNEQLYSSLEVAH